MTQIFPPPTQEDLLKAQQEIQKFVLQYRDRGIGVGVESSKQRVKISTFTALYRTESIANCNPVHDETGKDEEDDIEPSNILEMLRMASR